jgi:hypothetical protein
VLVRPGQDCSHDYGAGIVLSRIDVLTPTAYRETPVGRIEPRGADGELRTHCFDAVGGYEVIDRYRLNRLGAGRAALSGGRRSSGGPGRGPTGSS